MSLKRMFCTIGINGIYECVKDLNGDPLSETGTIYYKHILERIHNHAVKVSKLEFSLIVKSFRRIISK